MKHLQREHARRKRDLRREHARETWRLFCKNKAALFGLAVLILFVLVALFADLIVPYENAIAQDASVRLDGPSAEHIFGTDKYGRDVFAQIVHGSRRSLTLGIGTTLLSVVIGGLIGALCGFYGGKPDAIVMRICDIVMCIPALLFALAVVAALGADMINLIIAITIISVPSYIRVIRSVILSIVEQDYIYAARLCGTSNWKIILHHVLPNAMGPIIVQLTLAVGNAILSAASLNFLGMGVDSTLPDWGVMLNQGRNYLQTHSYLTTVPGIAISLTVLAMNWVGDGLRDAFDPRLRK